MWPVSVKGVLGPPGSVVLLHNERGEWELPGGRLEADDTSAEEALRREIAEELGLTVSVGHRPLGTWVYEPLPGRRVLIVTYTCAVPAWPDELTHSDEHDDVGLFTFAELDSLALPDGYRRDIARAHEAAIRD